MLLDIWTIYIIIGLILFFLYPLIYPWIVIQNAIFVLRNLSSKISIDLEKIKDEIMQKSKPRKNKKDLTFFLDFFVIQPTSLDPFGIVKKFEFLIRKEKNRIRKFVKDFSTEKEEEKLRNIEMGLVAAIQLNLIKKYIDHLCETIRKYKNYQLAMLIPFLIGFIQKQAKAIAKGAKAILDGFPIGDSIGALCVTYFISKEDKIFEENECIIVKKKIEDKNVIIIRAKGYGSRLGELGRLIEKIVKKEKPEKIIFIDAAAKFEGEKTGSIAVGVGVAIGGIGVEKFIVEEVASKYDIDVDSIVIKMSAEEALYPMKPEILEAKEKVIEKVKELVSEAKKKVLIIGVGNSVGIPNCKEELENVESKIVNYWKKYGEEEKRWLLEDLFGY